MRGDIVHKRTDIPEVLHDWVSARGKDVIEKFQLFRRKWRAIA